MNKYSISRVGVVGATGYAGVELLTRLARHPGVELVAAMASGRASAPVAVGDVTCVPASFEAMRAAAPDFVFLCTPHEASLDWVRALAGFTPAPRVIDLSGAFRFRDAAVFEAWYGMAHTAPEFLPGAVYGWPEKYRAAIAGAGLVANPGCYATAANTALWPLLGGRLIESEGVICDAKSGATGAGKGLRDDLQFATLATNCKAYGVHTHRHTPEIAGQTGAVDLTFTPHLLPTPRGILATTYVRLRPGVDAMALSAAYAAAYAREPFVRVRGGRLPELNDVNHTNYCELGFTVRGTQAIIVSCLDNLVKGAAGQALQNFNVMADWPETTALL